VHLNLSGNGIGAGGAERLTGVLTQCPALAYLDLSYNVICDAGAESLAVALGQCAALDQLELRGNGIEALGKGRLRSSWRGQASGLVL
jgi:Ran GTPase-activating protein (RanGAP) involved in mRNA processing and transport